MTFGQVRLATVLFLVARHEALPIRFVAEGGGPGMRVGSFRQLGEQSIPTDFLNGTGRPAGLSCRRNRGPVHSHGPDK
jgi:hypothetical protein